MRFLTVLAHGASISTFLYSGQSAARILYSRPAVIPPQLALQVMDRMKNTSNVIPGGSPFFYMSDPALNLFIISSLAMTPNPCQM